jgi:hypothetical protein
MGVGHAEDGHDGVADELLHGAAVPLEDRAHRVEVALQELPQRLGIERPPERGRAFDVREDDGDDLAHARGFLHWLAPLSAGRCGRVQIVRMRLRA